MNFFIVGLPRTRLAWLANYLSWGDMYCHLDATKHGLQFLEQDSTFAIRGTADHGAVLIQDQLIARFPDAKWVIIDRPFIEILSSVQALGVDPANRLHDLSVKQAELRAKVDPLVLSYDQLNHSLITLVDYLRPDGYSGWHCPSIRTTELLSLNVQMDTETGKHDLATLKPDLHPEPPHLSSANEEYKVLLWRMCQPNPLAFRFLVQAIGAALTWDHIVDGDPLDMVMLDKMFKYLLTEWPLNSFLIDNARSIMPVLSSCISDWQHSYQDGASKDSAYSIYADLPAAVAFIIGGQEHVDAFMPRIRQLVAILRKEDDVRDGDKK